ncbi:MAG: hypothetical protein V1813_04070 [Candidatus Aenigmatarchaeota archaeon]
MKISRIKVVNEKKYTEDVDALISLVMQGAPAGFGGGASETSFSPLELGFGGSKFKPAGVRD